jgi:hypothetical protein
MRSALRCDRVKASDNDLLGLWLSIKVFNTHASDMDLDQVSAARKQSQSGKTKARGCFVKKKAGEIHRELDRHDRARSRLLGPDLSPHYIYPTHATSVAPFAPTLHHVPSTSLAPTRPRPPSPPAHPPHTQRSTRRSTNSLQCHRPTAFHYPQTQYCKRADVAPHRYVHKEKKIHPLPPLRLPIQDAWPNKWEI